VGGLGCWGVGMGDGGLGIGDWAQSPIPNPQSPIPNPHMNQLNRIFNYIYFKILKNKNIEAIIIFNFH